MWIVKIGGSWVENSKLPILVNLLQKFIDQKIVLVAGGGFFLLTLLGQFIIKIKCPNIRDIS